MLYRLLQGIIWLGIRIYYREIKVVNRFYLEQTGPVIIIANHPNTLMDAWIMAYINRRKVHFVAKSTFFNSPIKRKILHALGMIPINRSSDITVSGINNKDSFEACYQILEAGGILVVFPEGTSYLERQLRALKTGTARIALTVAQRNIGKLTITILPIGLNYIDAHQFRGKVKVHVGKPIQITPKMISDFAIHQGIVAKALTADFRTALSRVFVTIEDTRKERLIEDLRDLFDTKYSSNKSGVSNSIHLIHEIKQRLEIFSLVAPWKIDKISEEVILLKQELTASGIRADFLDRTYRKNLYSWQYIQTAVFLILSFPLFLYGWLHNSLPYKIIGYIVPKLSHEKEYHAPITVLLGLICYPVNYLTILLLLSYWFPITIIEQVIYFVTLPVSGFFAHLYLRTYHHMRSKRKFGRFARERGQTFATMKASRLALKTLIFND